MKDLSAFLMEACDCGKDCDNKACELEEESIASENDFREWARAKFEEVFGDELDEKRMKNTVDGFLKDNKELVDKGDWGELVGMFNQSFSK